MLKPKPIIDKDVLKGYLDQFIIINDTPYIFNGVTKSVIDHPKLIKFMGESYYEIWLFCATRKNFTNSELGISSDNIVRLKDKKPIEYNLTERFLNAFSGNEWIPLSADTLPYCKKPNRPINLEIVGKGIDKEGRFIMTATYFGEIQDEYLTLKDVGITHFMPTHIFKNKYPGVARDIGIN